MFKTNNARNETRTRTIAGRKVTLYSGVRYMAHRPFISLRRGAARPESRYPVTIQPFSTSPDYAQTVVLDGMNYDDANKFLLAFNNGAMTFDGRLW